MGEQVHSQIKPDSYRYINWILFIFAALANSIPTQAFSGITPTISKLYDLSQFEANIPSLTYPLSYLFILIPANYILDKKGLKIGTLICEMCMIIGLLLRLLINVNYYLFCAGTFVCSLGFCFMISGATKFANLWFPQKQIFLATSISVFALFASDALGTFLSTYFIRQDATKSLVFDFFLWQSVVMIIAHIAMALFFKDKPKNMQNFASEAKRNQFKQDLKSLLKNSNYRNIFLAITFVFGDFSVIFVFLPWITKTYHYQTLSNGIIVACANLVGCLGCVLISLFGKQYTYRIKCIFLGFGLIFSTAFMWISLQLGSPVITYISGGCIGIFGYPLLTTATDFATQTTFPVGEATAGGILLFGGQFLGVILVVIFSNFFDGESIILTRVLNSILILMFVISLIFLFKMKEILRRNEYERLKIDQSALLPMKEEQI